MATMHAEEGVILQAAKRGYPTEGLTLICPWAACHECAKAIAKSGVREVIAHGDAIDRTPDRWKKSMEMSMSIFDDWKVKYTKIYGKIGDCENLFDGKIWYP